LSIFLEIVARLIDNEIKTRNNTALAQQNAFCEKLIYWVTIDKGFLWKEKTLMVIC
jgi:hypothetical protein